MLYMCVLASSIQEQWEVNYHLNPQTLPIREKKNCPFDDIIYLESERKLTIWRYHLLGKGELIVDRVQMSSPQWSLTFLARYRWGKKQTGSNSSPNPGFLLVLKIRICHPPAKIITILKLSPVLHKWYIQLQLRILFRTR